MNLHVINTISLVNWDFKTTTILKKNSHDKEMSVRFFFIES